jgi:hypothetical protein
MRPKILRDQPQDIRTLRRSERGDEGKKQKQTLHGPPACLKDPILGNPGFIKEQETAYASL